MTPLYQRTFDMYALSLPRGHGFGNTPPVAAFQSDDGQSYGAVLRDDSDGRFGFLCMRRRVDHVWAKIEEDGGFAHFASAEYALSLALRDGGPLEPIPPGIKARPKLYELGQKGASSVFKSLGRKVHHAAAWALQQVYLAMPNPDLNWARDCQTSNFHTRLWEAYLLACFREQGRFVSQDEPSPDFRVTDKAGNSVWIEAVTANAEPYDHASAARVAAPTDPVERQIGRAAVRFARTLRSKLQKRYDTMAHVCDAPFAIAIADFHAPGSMTWSREALPAYLFGQHGVVQQRNGQQIAAGQSISTLLGEDAIPAGLFRDPANSGLAAVIFSNAGTIAKFNRMGFLSGVRPQGIKMQREGYLYDRTPGALESIAFKLDVDNADYAALWPFVGESWSLELEIFHNPLAKHPLPFDLLPECTHWFKQDGEIVCRAHYENTILSSQTVVHDE